MTKKDDDYTNEIEALNAPVQQKQSYKGLIGIAAVVAAFAGYEGYKYYASQTSNEQIAVEQSTVEEFQRANNSKIEVQKPISIEPVPQVVEKVVEVEVDKSNEIAELQKQIEALKNGSKSPEEIAKIVQAAVDDHAAKMKMEYNTELARIEAEAELERNKLNARDEALRLAAEEEQRREQSRLQAERQRAYEERRKKAEALQQARIRSKMLGSDDSSSSDPVRTKDGTIEDTRTGDEKFLTDNPRDEYTATVAQQIPYPSETIMEGTFIHAALETAISSDLPGSIRAVVVSDVYSFDGRNVLMPKGTRLIGTYRSITDIAQRRALVLWQRAIMPDGLSVVMNANGADNLGRSGHGGKVNTHFFERFGSAALISIVTAIPTILSAETGGSDATTEVLQSTSENTSAAVSEIMADYLSIKPTISVRHGDAITIIVDQDIIIKS